MDRILYRHKDHTPPPWLPENVSVQRSKSGHIFDSSGAAKWGPIDTSDCVWHDLHDGWQVAVTGPTALPSRRRTFPGSPHEVQAADGSRLPVLPVHDRHARVWLTPAVLDVEGDPLLPRTIRHDGTRLITEYDARQQSMIDAAQECRRLTVDEDGGEIDETTAAHIAAEAVAWSYHIPATAVLALGLLDTGMLRRVLLTLCGVTQATDGDGELIVDYLAAVDGGTDGGP